MSTEAVELVKKMNREWESFKAENDRRLAEIEKRGDGRGDPLTEEKINKHSAAIGALQAQLDELDKRSQRVGTQVAPEASAVARHREAFNAFLRKGNEAGLADLQASINLGTDTEGGYLVPKTLDSEIEKYEIDNSPMRQVCRVIPVTNENYEKLVKQGSAGTGWVGEEEARPETTTPTWNSLKPYFGEVYANPGLTQKALDDVGLNLEAELGEDIGLAFGADENDAFTNGTGVKKPKGLTAYSMAATADGSRAFGVIEKLHTASAGNFVIDKMIDLVHKLHRGYRQNASWMLTTLGLGAVRKLKSGDLYVFQPSLLAGQPASLLGYPIVENDDMPAVASDVVGAYFGDFRRAYYVVDVRGVRMLRDPYSNKPKVHFYTTKRVGGMLVNDRALKALVLSA